MKSDERINIINELDKEVVRTRELLNLGLSNNDISVLLKDGLLKRKDRGIYEVNKKIDYDDVYENIFRCLLEGSSIKAVKYIDILRNSDDERYRHDGNYYAVLLSYFVDLEEGYVGNITLKDIRVFDDDKRFSNPQEINRVRKLMFSREGYFVKGSTIHRYNVLNRIEYCLVQKFYTLKRRRCLAIYNAIDTGNYEVIIKEVEKLARIYKLSNSMQAILILAMDCKDMTEGKKIKLSDYRTTSMLEAVKNKNYNLAKKLNGTNNKYIHTDRLIDEAIELASGEKKNVKISDQVMEIVNDRNSLKERGIVTLDPINHLECSSLLDYLKDVKYIIPLVVSDEYGRRRVVLRYSEYVKGCKDIKTRLVKKARSCYKDEDYVECINLCKEFLKMSDNNSDIVYNMLSRCYEKLENYELAIEYANLLIKFSYGDNRTNNIVRRDNLVDKKNVPSYDMAKILELMETGMNVFEVCNKLNLDEEKILLVLLELAVLAFKSGNEILGNKYLKYVEKSKGKTIDVKRIWESVIKNKKLYLLQAREEDFALKLEC